MTCGSVTRKFTNIDKLYNGGSEQVLTRKLNYKNEKCQNFVKNGWIVKNYRVLYSLSPTDTHDIWQNL